MSKEQITKNKDLKENRVWLGKDGIIYVYVGKADTEEDIMKMLDEIKGLIEKFPNKAKILLNLVTNSIIKSSQFRKRAGVKFKEIEELCERAALYGGNIITRTISSFIINTIGLKDIKVFETKEEALKWLKK